MGQMGHVAERVEFFGLLRSQWSHAPAIERGAFAQCRRQGEQETDCLVSFLRRLGSSLAVKQFRDCAFSNRDLVFFEAFGPTQRRFTCV